MLAFSTDELVTRWRSEVVDKITDVNGSDEDCLWSDYDAYGYLTEAVDAVAKLTDGLYKVVRLPFLAGDQMVRLPSYVLDIREARLVNTNRPVDQANANDTNYGWVLDYGMKWLGASALHEGSGEPTHFIRDFEAKALRLVPHPLVADTLEIQCTITTATFMEAGVPLPFTDIEDQRLLLHKMKALAYLKQDAETEDLARAKLFAALFEQGAMDRKSALQRMRRKPSVMRFNW